MKTIKLIKYTLFAIFIGGLISCTDLSERLYDNIASENYYNTKDDVIRAVVRPYEHAYWTVSQLYDIQEN